MQTENGFFSTSVGKKIIMAISGIFLMIFLVIHLFGNLFLFVGEEAFNSYVENLDKIKPLIRVIEIVLALGFIYHIYNGIFLTLKNFSSSGFKRYEIKETSPEVSWTSRSMYISAAVIFFFLVVHLSHFWYNFNLVDIKKDYYNFVVSSFHNFWYSALYVFSVLFLGFHLYHGFESSFQSLGLNHKKYTPYIVMFGKLYSIAITIGFASIPIYFYLISIIGGK
jgi:succinate dehydrogenase / fumarate reductase cytochrome b subunit